MYIGKVYYFCSKIKNKLLMKVFLILTLVKVGQRYENVAIPVSRKTFVKYKRKFSSKIQCDYNQVIIYAPVSGLSSYLLEKVFNLAYNYTNSLD